MSDYGNKRFGTSLQIALHDKHNGTYRGSIFLKNWTVLYGQDSVYDDTTNLAPSGNATAKELFDPMGASYYVIAVILVYGMSIVALIASHIKRKKAKLVEDRQINKYLREFQTVKEESSRETYKNLKKRIKEQINWDKQNKSTNTLHHNLSQALLPMLAVGVTLPRQNRTSSISSASFQGSRSSLGAVHSRNGSLGQINLSQPRSRTNSIGSTNSVSSPMSAPSGEPPPGKHDRKRGLANLYSASNNDYPLEKILEESLDSRANSFKRRSSKRSMTPSVDSSAIINDRTVDLKRLSDDLTESRYLPVPSGDAQSVQNGNHTMLDSSHGDISHPPFIAGIHRPHIVIPHSHATSADDIAKSSHTPPLGPVANSISETTLSDRPVFTLEVPSPNFYKTEQIWIPCSGDSLPNDTSYSNRSFRHSPSPSKSRGGSPRYSRDSMTHDSTANNSDSETEQLLHITCV